MLRGAFFEEGAEAAGDFPLLAGAHHPGRDAQRFGPADGTIDDETLERLKALGYVN